MLMHMLRIGVCLRISPLFPLSRKAGSLPFTSAAESSSSPALRPTEVFRLGYQRDSRFRLMRWSVARSHRQVFEGTLWVGEGDRGVFRLNGK